MLLKTEDIFDNKYVILKILGQGGMGVVYLARHLQLNTLWAIKQMHKKAQGPTNLLAEPEILKKLNHPKIPRIFDIIESETSIYIIIDYVEGDSLDKLLKQKGRFNEKEVIHFSLQVCDILGYLHAQKPKPVIYRDLKPSNLMLTADGSIKLIDFGIAREHKAKSSADTEYLGTKGFAAPEQYGTSQSDMRSDIYCFGVTMYNLLTGKNPNEPPYEIIPVRRLSKKYSDGIEHIIMKCTQKDPKDRYQQIEEVLNDLKNIDKFSHKKNQKTNQKNYIKLLLTSAVIFGILSFLSWIQLKKIGFEGPIALFIRIMEGDFSVFSEKSVLAFLITLFIFVSSTSGYIYRLFKSAGNAYSQMLHHPMRIEDSAHATAEKAPTALPSRLPENKKSSEKEDEIAQELQRLQKAIETQHNPKSQTKVNNKEDDATELFDGDPDKTEGL